MKSYHSCYMFIVKPYYKVFTLYLKWIICIIKAISCTLQAKSIKCICFQSLRNFLSVSLPFAPSLLLIFTNACTFAHTLSLSHTHTVHFHTLTFTLPFSLPLYYSPSLLFALTLSLSLSHSHIPILSLSHTLTHSNSNLLTHSLSHSNIPILS